MEEVFKYKLRVACNLQDVKTYVTDRLRSSFLMEKEKVPDENLDHGDMNEINILKCAIFLRI